MSLVGIWFDGGGKFGYGNISRSLELAKELSRRGHEIVNVPLSKKASKLCAAPFGKRGVADVVFLDVPYAGDEEVRRAHDFGASVLALDYEGSIAPEAIVSLHDIRNRPKDSRFYVGLDFAIIRSEIQAVKKKKFPLTDVLVVLGGGDHQGLFAKIVRRMPSVPFCLVQGPNGKALKIRGKNLKILKNPVELPQLMAGCQWAVTSGGTTLLEMLYLGKAVHVVPRNEAERVFARQFLEKEALLGLGLEQLGKPAPIHKKICEKKGPTLIDGRGVERVADIVENLI